MLETKDIWNSYSPETKQEIVKTCLAELHQIKTDRHPLSLTEKQGGICWRRTKLETFLSNVMQWEEENA